ncbi:hypothetical protein R75461_07772 [Paraburkholderia nemoris]|uniref:hypothetical protein n=1 Tax=Paraburkholderia nemoris TaxID=2793076 RepID=UPI00190D2512|nr:MULTISPECIES: hypothetical protein [Paraburkholderia]MBK3786529.1 hypothetical protein [Paraburkholderia aspalathi]CAE6857098.1 hypothetical protein R75461_07772 [Paraburkholderia nemoris]
MYLTSEERDALRQAAQEGIHAINHQVFRLRTGNPTAFHDGNSLRERVFLIEPRNVTWYRDFIRPAPPKGN